MKKLVALALLLSAASISLYASEEYKKKEYNKAVYTLIPNIIALATLDVSDEELSYKTSRSNQDKNLNYAISFILKTKKNESNDFRLDYLDEINGKHAIIKATGTPGLYKREGVFYTSEKFNEIASETAELILKQPVDIFDREFKQELINGDEGYCITFLCKNLKEQK